MKISKKIVLTFALFIAILMPSTIFASTTTVKTNEEFAEALKTSGTIVVDNDITVNSVLDISENDIVLDLNGHTISFASGKRLNLKKGSLTITGTGTMKETVYNTAPVVVYGSATDEGANYGVLTIEKNVTLSGYYGTFVSLNSNHAFGAVINVYGTVLGNCITSGNCGAGIYVNGSNKDITGNVPIINIYKDSVVGNDITGGIYAAGYAKWNIDGATIKGNGYGIGLKAGILNIKNTTITEISDKLKEGSYNGNGINPTGAAIQIESNPGYAGKMTINIENSTFESKNGNVFYHYVATKDGSAGENNLLSMTVSGGTYKGGIDLIDDDNVLFKSGQYTSDNIVNYLENDYVIGIDNNNYYSPCNVVFSEGLALNEKDNLLYITPGTLVSVSALKGYKILSLTVITNDNEEITVNDNKFTMPEKYVEIHASIVKESDEPVTLGEEVKAEDVKELLDVKLDNTDTGLADALDLSKMTEIDTTTFDILSVEVVKTIEKYDTENNILVFDIKPYIFYGRKNALIPNEAINGAVKIKLPVPSKITDTYAKVVHKSDDKVLDTKEYEIKSNESGKYIEIETKSFSTFEVSFYTPVKVENPKTGDNVVLYITIGIIATIGIGYTVLNIYKRYNN